MPHLIMQIARRTIERRLLALPVEFNPDGSPADILAPPVPRQDTIATPFGPVRYRFVFRDVALRSTAGTARCTLAITFNDGSLEVLGSGLAVGALGGSITIPFQLGFAAAPGGTQGQVAQLNADFSSTQVNFLFDDESREKIANEFGPSMPGRLENLLSARLTLEFRAMGAAPAGINFDLTPGVPSEALMTVDSLPSVVWVDPETLALSLRYGANPVPPSFQPVPFISGLTTIGLRLSNDGFQRTLRAQAVRRIARDMLSDRIRDGFVRSAYIARGGQGSITDADQAAGQAALDAHLSTPRGQAELAAATPRPVGSGRMRKTVPMPDPFTDITPEIEELDLWLGNGVVEGRAHVKGVLASFGFSATVRFRARPVLVQGNPPSVEMHDVQVDEPDLKISLPFWLEWAAAILVGRLAGPVFGVIVAFLLSSIIAEIAKAFLPDDIAAGAAEHGPQEVAGLPEGAALRELIVVPSHMEMRGTWRIRLEDPRPFHPTARITSRVVQRRMMGTPTTGTAYFTCLGALGVLADSTPQRGTAFRYTQRRWHTRVRLMLEISALPLPLTRFPWRISVGYRSTAQYRFPVLPSSTHVLQPGTLAISEAVWLPEPPHKGTIEHREFSIGVEQPEEDVFVLDVPPSAASIVIAVSTAVEDGSGNTWTVFHQEDVPNETLVFNDDYAQFTARCESGRREWQLVETPSLLDRVWNPPDAHLKYVQQAILTSQPGVTRQLDAVVGARGLEGLQELLAPSRFQ